MKMNNFMNQPVPHNITDEDIIAEYRKYNDIKKVAKIFDLSLQDIRVVLRKSKIL